MDRQLIMNALQNIPTDDLENFLMSLPDDKLPTEFVEARNNQYPISQEVSANGETPDYSYLDTPGLNSIANNTVSGGPNFDWISSYMEDSPTSLVEDEEFSWLGESTGSPLNSLAIKEDLSDKKGPGQLKLKEPKLPEEKDRNSPNFTSDASLPYFMDGSTNN